MRTHIERSVDGHGSTIMLCGKIKTRRSRLPLPIYCTRCVRRMMDELKRRGIAA